MLKYKGKDNHTQILPVRENIRQLRGNDPFTYSHGNLRIWVQRVSYAGQAKRHGKKGPSQAIPFTSCSCTCTCNNSNHGHARMYRIKTMAYWQMSVSSESTLISKKRNFNTQEKQT